MTHDCFEGATEHSTPQTAYDSIFKYNLNAPLKNGGNALDLNNPIDTANKLNSNGSIEYSENGSTNANSSDVTQHDGVWLLKETSKLEVDKNPLKVTNYQTTEEVKAVMYSNYFVSTLSQSVDDEKEGKALEGYLQDVRCKSNKNNVVLQGTNKENILSSYAAVSNTKPNGCDEVRGDGGDDTIVAVGNLPQKLVGESGDDIFDLRNVKDVSGFTYISDFGDGRDVLRFSEKEMRFYKTGDPGHGYQNGVGIYKSDKLIAVVVGQKIKELENRSDLLDPSKKLAIFVND